ATVTVTPAAAASFCGEAPAETRAGDLFDVTVYAVDAFGNLATDYAGTVHFSSADAGATLPEDYRFTVDDAGVHTFVGLTLTTADFQDVTATDTVSGSLTGSAAVYVLPGAAAFFLVAAPASVGAGVPFDLTVHALDAFGNLAWDYGGLVQFGSSDPTAVLPADYRFTADDFG